MVEENVCRLGIPLRLLVRLHGAVLTAVVAVAAVTLAFSCWPSPMCHVPTWMPLLWAFAGGMVAGVSGFVVIAEVLTPHRTPVYLTAAQVRALAAEAATEKL